MDFDSSALPSKVSVISEIVSRNFIRQFICSVVLPNMTVLVGTNDLDRGGVRYNIEKVINHEEFNDDYHDIGLIRIKGTIRFTSRVQSIQLSNESVPPNTTLEMSKPSLIKSSPRVVQAFNLMIFETHCRWMGLFGVRCTRNAK